MKLLGTIVITAVLFGIALFAGTAQAADGKEIFQAKCQACHGATGMGNETLAKAFKLEPEWLNLTKKQTQAYRDTELADIVKFGKGRMPAFNGKLGDADIKAVVQFIRSLKK